ncbi:MAG TPA: hypothetical protein VF137_11640 [Candidatus Dormibacteraeota bacterium]
MPRLLLAFAAASMLVACGGQTATTPKTGAASGPATVSSTSSKLGTILVSGQKATLYLFVKDTSTASTCYGQCAADWPPLLTQGAPHAGPGVDSSKLGTTKRSDGTTEVTYNGHPLYFYEADDGMSGSTKGQGLDLNGGEWYVLNTSGMQVESQGS